MQKVSVIKGDTLTIPIITKLPSGARLDINGYTFFFTIKNKLDNDNTDNQAVLRKTWTTHSNPINGETILNATATEMDIAAGNYYADIQLKSPAGEIRTPAIFILEVKNAVTNRTT